MIVLHKFSSRKERGVRYQLKLSQHEDVALSMDGSTRKLLHG